jgi:tetratricopeptide (TPR) repeat protein
MTHGRSRRQSPVGAGASAPAPVVAQRLAIAGALILVLLAYANFFHNSFHFDDDHVIVENPAIRSLANLPRFFTDAHTFSSLPSNATYRPLVTLSFALDYAVRHSLDPVPFHATQLVLLLIVGALLVFVYRDVLGKEHVTLAIAAAALFSVHTANTETMNFLSSRSELLSAVGFLAAFLIYVRHYKWPWYLIPLAIGALAKAPVVIFAGIVIAWVRLIERKPMLKAVQAAVPSFVTGIVLLIALNAMNAREWVAGGGSRLGYLMTQPYVWLHYARLAILPVGLTADTDLEILPHWYDTNAIAGYLFVAVLCIAIVRLGRTSRTAPVAFGLAWFAITLLPTSSFFPLAEVANEHRLFFSLMGFAIAFVATVDLIPRKQLAYAGLGVFILALAIGTHIRNRAWLSEETLWQDVTIKSPHNGRGWMNYGLTQMEAGRYAEAKRVFDRATQYSPNYSTLEINRGIVAAALGDNAEAERLFRRALELNPDRNAHFYYARFLVRRGRVDEARVHLHAASTAAPNWPPPRELMASLELRKVTSP